MKFSTSKLAILSVFLLVPFLLSGCLFGGEASKQAAADKLIKEGLTLKDKHEYSDALDKFLAASEAYPNYYKPYIHVAGIYTLKGQDEKALEVLEDALKVSNGEKEVSYELALIYSKEGNYEKAKEYLDKAVLSGTDTSNLLMAQTLYHLNKIDDGKKYALRVDEKSPQYQDAAVLLALGATNPDTVKSETEKLTASRLLSIATDLDFYGETFEKYEGDKDNEAFLKTTKGFVFLKAGFPEAAIAILEPVAESKLEYFEPRLYLGIAYEQTDKNDKAVSTMQEAISLNPLNSTTYQVLGKVAFKQNNVSEFTTNYESAIGYSSEDERQEIRKEYVERLEAKKLYTTAEKIYVDLLKDNTEDNSAELDYQNGLISMLVLDAKEYDKALDYSNKYLASAEYKAIVATAEKADVARFLAYTCGANVEKSERVKALEQCDSAIEKYPYTAVAYYYKGKIEYDLKNDKEAKEFLQTAIDLDITGEVSSRASNLLEDI